MFKLYTFMLIVVALAGCGGSVTHRPINNLVSFTETDASGHQVRHLSFILAGEPAQTCIAGDWKKAKVVKDLEGYTHDPAYTLENGRLEILLVNQVCDSYDSYVGKLSNGQFHGEHVAYGLGFSKTLGKVSGTYEGGWIHASPAANGQPGGTGR